MLKREKKSFLFVKTFARNQSSNGIILSPVRVHSVSDRVIFDCAVVRILPFNHRPTERLRKQFLNWVCIWLKTPRPDESLLETRCKSKTLRSFEKRTAHSIKTCTKNYGTATALNCIFPILSRYISDISIPDMPVSQIFNRNAIAFTKYIVGEEEVTT